jgi:hypothetical protein
VMVPFQNEIQQPEVYPRWQQLLKIVIS